MDRIWLAPAAFLYGIAISVRHKLFDWKILRSEQYDIPIICVGNLTVGGTGKTPVSEFLIRNLKREWNVALLSRGYKRRTRGYLEVETNTPFMDAGDEPKQVKLKFPDITVAVCEKRAQGIAEIRRRHPEVNLIVLDDGFQHRHVEPWVNIVLMDYTRPVYHDHLLPWGSLRDNLSQLHRAHYVLVTKCPDDMNALDRRLVLKSLGLFPYQELYFCSTRTCAATPVFGEAAHLQILPGQDVVAMSGIGNPAAFLESVSAQFNVVGTLEYPDHHPYHSRDLKDMSAALEQSPPGTILLTTEKDAVKLTNSRKIPQNIRERLFYVPIKIAFGENTEKDFINSLNRDIRTDPKDRLLHSQ